MTFNKEQDYWVSAYSTNEFLSIETYFGLGRFAIDPLFPPHFLQPNENEKIGEIVLQALSNNRSLTSIEEHIDFFKPEKSKGKYTTWIAILMGKYRYKTKRALFKDMKKCSIHMINKQITISHSFHEKLEAWSGDRINESDYVILSIDISPIEIGAALKLALSRCSG